MKTRYVTILVLAMAAAIILTSPLSCWAAEQEEEESIWAEDEPNQGQRKFELTEERIERMMNRLKEADPEKAKELETLRAKDPEKFKAELRKVMRERFGKRMRERMGRRERAGICPPAAPGMMTPGGPGGPGGFGEGRGGPMEMRERHGEYLEWLEKNYPEEAKELANLEGKNPELYGRRVGLGLRKHRRIFEAAKENPALAEVLKENLKLTEEQQQLVKKIKAATDDAEKKKLTGELTTVVDKKFDLIVKRKQMTYEQMLKRLEELKGEVKKSEAQAEKWKDSTFKSESVKARVEELISGEEEFSWD
jgi:ribosomal protein L11